MPCVFSHRGFTLLELVMVLALMGLVLGLTTLAAFSSDDRVLRVEADRLVQLWAIAYEEAQLSGTTVVWEADAQGYRFLRREGEELKPVQNDTSLRAREWPLTPMKVAEASLTSEFSTPSPAPGVERRVRLAFERHGAGDPFQVALQHAQSSAVIRGDGLGNFKTLD